MLRMGTNNPAFDKNSWITALNTSESGVCNQGKALSYKPLPGVKHRQGRVFCVEPGPSTYKRLEEAASTLGWDGMGLTTVQGAVSDTDGVALFPNVQFGVEWFGLSTCSGKSKASDDCVEVPAYQLDTFTAKHVVDKSVPIDILSIDTEGSDFTVMKSGLETIKQASYLEFEFHQQGNWNNQNLADAIEYVDELGFTCYWAGVGGLTRITECWLDVYGSFHSWSNVACVNRNNGSLLNIMETLFQQCLDRMK